VKKILNSVDIDLIVTKNVDDNIFSWIDAIILKDRKR
jgi:DNA polymerase III delta subunit